MYENWEGANLFDTNFEGVQSEAVLSDSFFAELLRNRIEKESEFKTVYTGKLDAIIAKNLIEKFSNKFGGNEIVARFTAHIMNATSRDTNMETDAITGILTKEKAEEIIERYNKAMANMP